MGVEPRPATAGVLVPLHPEQVDADDRSLRWVVAAGTFDFVGAPVGLPAEIAALIADGTLESVEIEPTAVRTRLASGRHWRQEGARVRTALQIAIARPTEWSAAATGTASESADDVLRMAVREVIDGEVGQYVLSHGGQVELVDVHDGRVEVALRGACTHCPAAGFTLTDRFETAIRARYPALRSIVAREVEPAGNRPGWLGLPSLRRR